MVQEAFRAQTYGVPPARSDGAALLQLFFAISGMFDCKEMLSEMLGDRRQQVDNQEPAQVSSERRTEANRWKYF